VDGGVVVGVLAGLVAAWAALIALLWVVRPHDVRLGELVRIVPDVVRLVRNLIADRTVGWGVRVALVVLLAWLISPIDLIPEFVPVLGPLDDVVVAVIVLRYVRRRLGTEALRDRWAGSPAGFALLLRLVGGGERS
jgi:uncharacterized membrane protein YkvA (DUF1232 family)